MAMIRRFLRRRAEPVEPAEPLEPAEPVEPHKPAGPANPAEPAESVDRAVDPVSGLPSPLAAFATILAGLVVVYFFPPAATILAWPFLFVLPGWLLVTRAAPGLGAPGKLAVGVVASIYVSAHLVNAVATVAGGFGRDTVLMCVYLLAVAAYVLAVAPLPWLAPPPRISARSAVAELRREPVPWAIAGFAALVVGGILAVSSFHLTSAGWVSGGWNWSDYLVHVSIGASIQNGNFPPQVPYFSGVPLSYHWFADFHGAIAGTVAGMDVIPVYTFTNGLMAAVLALVSWELAMVMSHDRRVAGLAAVFVVFGGGMGFIRLPLDIISTHQSVGSLVSAGSYDNTWAPGWPYFRIASVLGTGLLPHRATALGLPGLVAAVLLVRVSLGERPAGMLLAGLIAALLAPFHFFAFPATYLIVLLYVLARREWRRPTWIRDGLLFLAPLILAVPFVVGPALQQLGHGYFGLVSGWESASFGDGPAAVVFFYVTNLGVPFMLAPLAATRRDLPDRAFLFAWALALFIIPNVIKVSAVQFDMNKYFQMMWIAVAIMAAWLVRSWPRPVIAGILVLSVLSPALVAVWHVTSSTVAMTPAQDRAANWIAINTPERSVFVTDAWINSPVDLAGRLRITTYGPYAANLGYDPDPRAADVHSVYCDGDSRAAAVMAHYGATYVLSSGGRLDCSGHAPTDFGKSSLFQTVYNVGGVEVWELRGR